MPKGLPSETGGRFLKAGAKEAGRFRVEGKTYEVKDGDVLHFLQSDPANLADVFGQSHRKCDCSGDAAGMGYHPTRKHTLKLPCEGDERDILAIRSLLGIDSPQQTGTSSHG